MIEWYYSELGQTKGPISETALIGKILKEELHLDSYVTDGMDKPWKKVQDIPDLLVKIHRPEVLPHVTDFPDYVVQNDHPAPKGNIYFYIPIRRFVLMNILSVGLYQLYWFYKQWHYWAVKHKQGHQSFDRVAGNIFMELMIMEKIETDKELNAVYRADFNGTALFWMWFLIGGVVAIIYLLVKKMDFSFILVSAAIGILDIGFLVPVQSYINRVNDKLGNTYDKPSFGHYLCLVLGLGTAVLTYIMMPLIRLLKG